MNYSDNAPLPWSAGYCGGRRRSVGEGSRSLSVSATHDLSLSLLSFSSSPSRFRLPLSFSLFHLSSLVSHLSLYPCLSLSSGSLEKVAARFPFSKGRCLRSCITTRFQIFKGGEYGLHLGLRTKLNQNKNLAQLNNPGRYSIARE